MVVFKYLFIFCLFAFVGWILEFIYRSINTKKIINPGFMSGCVVPLYGFGAVILEIICNLFDKISLNYKIVLIFIISIILLSILELISGLILLKFFHLKLWDYSNYKLNYKGLICLKFSIFWGLLSLLYYLFIHKYINGLAISFINNTICIFILGIYIGIFLIDLSVSINLLSNLKKYSKSVKQIIDLEKLKIDSSIEEQRRKFTKAIYPYLSLNKYLKEKMKDKR